jgi:lysozyme
MLLSPSGAAFIGREEGCVLHPYNDSASPPNATIGIGHLIHFGPVTGADVARYRNFSRQDAIRLLLRDASICEQAIARYVHVGLNQNEYDALCSLIFNIGTGGFAGSSVLRFLNAGNRRAAADAFLLWRNPGLLGRRLRERTLFLTSGGPVRPPHPPHRPSKLDVLLPRERRVVREYDALKRQNKNRPRRAELWHEMVAMRKAVWRAAQASGWRKLHRKERYEILRSRTRV